MHQVSFITRWKTALSLFVINILGVSSQQNCITPNGETAFCKPIFLCGIFVRTLQQGYDLQQKKFIFESLCHFDKNNQAVVCCGGDTRYRSLLPDRNQWISGISCRTPNGETAKCIRIESCPILYDVVLTTDANIIKFLQASQCGYHGSPLVCCGSRASYAPPSTPKPFVRRPELLPNSNECGRQLESNKILNGENTAPEEFPWTAILHYRNSSGFEQFSCGGTLINERYIVTAAHCIKGRILTAIGTLFKVQLGEWNTETEEDCFEGGGLRICTDKPVDFGIEEMIAHSEYTEGRNRYHDIALVRLDRDVKFTPYVSPVCLPQSNDQISIGQKLTVVGWGMTETARYSVIKQKLDIPVVDNSQCRGVFSRVNVNVGDYQICAGGEKGKDSCKGDSGGPLLGQRGEQFYLEGIVSFGTVCGEEGWPGIYTKVAKYRDWIEGNIRP